MKKSKNKKIILEMELTPFLNINGDSDNPYSKGIFLQGIPLIAKERKKQKKGIIFENEIGSNIYQIVKKKNKKYYCRIISKK
jgi:hypothetical protein